MEKIRLAIADDQLLFRKGLAALIQKAEDIELVTEVDNGKELLDRIREGKINPHVALIDMNMPVMNGAELKDRKSVV